MVGSWYYLWTKGNWDYANVYSTWLDRYRAQRSEAEGFDKDKLEYLTDYISDLKYQRDLIYGHSLAREATAAAEGEASTADAKKATDAEE